MIEWDEDSTRSYFEAELKEKRWEMLDKGTSVLNRLSHALENFSKYGLRKATDEGLSESD